MPNVGDQRAIGDQSYVVISSRDPKVKTHIDQMNESITRVENPRFLQSVLAKYDVQSGAPNVAMAHVTPGCDGCNNAKKPKECIAGLREGGFLRCLPCGRRMCSFEPRNKSSSGAWMVAANDVPLVADYVSGTSSLIRHLIKDLPASHPLVSAARVHIGQGKIILDRVKEGRIGPKHKPTSLPDTANLRPHEAIASDVAAIDELADRVHQRANEPKASPDNDDNGPPFGAYPAMDQYVPPGFDLDPPDEEEEGGVEALLPADVASSGWAEDEAGPSDPKRRKTGTSAGQRGRGGARGRGRGRGRGAAPVA